LRLNPVAKAVIAVIAVSAAPALSAQPLGSAARVGISGVFRERSLPKIDTLDRPTRWHRLAIGATMGGIADRSAQDEMPHGLIGAVSGAIVGGGLGYLYAGAHCDNGVACNATRGILTGATAGAAVGVVIEYFVRNGQR
jgi:hypothetical protein